MKAPPDLPAPFHATIKVQNWRLILKASIKTPILPALW